MRDCKVCKTPNSVASTRGPATCPACKRAKYLAVKKRYQQSEKGKATTRAREERPDVREKRRLFAASAQGRMNKAKYEATEKGKTTRMRALHKYRISDRAKMTVALYHQRTKDLPSRIAVKQRAYDRYKQTEKMKAKRRRAYARRKDAIVPDRPFTAEDWLEIVEQHKHRCHYCGKRRVLTIDHVIPLSKGGLHVKENIVPACQSCNSQKKDRLIRLC